MITISLSFQKQCRRGGEEGKYLKPIVKLVYGDIIDNRVMSQIVLIYQIYNSLMGEKCFP